MKKPAILIVTVAPFWPFMGSSVNIALPSLAKSVYSLFLGLGLSNFQVLK